MTVKSILYEIWDFIKKNFLVLVAAVIFFIFYFSGCNGSASGGKTTHDTTTVTTQQPQPIVIMPSYPPQQAGSTVYIPIPPSSQGVIPASTIDGLVAQVKDLSGRIEALGNQYYAVKNYEDSIQLKDTAGQRVGVVNLKQVVSENTLKSTQPTYQLSFPHTYTTITNTVYPKPKNQVYVGIGVESLLNTPKLQQVDLGLMLRNKKENIIALSGVYDLPNKSPGIKVGYFTKIKL